MDKKLYLIEAPFKGCIISNVTLDDTGEHYVEFSGYLHNNGGPNLTLEEYRKLDDKKAVLILVDDKGLDRLIQKYNKSLIEPPKEITEERFWEMFEILPPSRHSTFAQWETFYVCERITGNLVSWFARNQTDNTHYELINDASIKTDKLIEILNNQLVILK